ncbi:hypothetical protein J3F84DRAFT_383607 [Trichoderma pleuroticola]
MQARAQCSTRRDGRRVERQRDQMEQASSVSSPSSNHSQQQQDRAAHHNLRWMLPGYLNCLAPTWTGQQPRLVEARRPLIPLSLVQP